MNKIVCVTKQIKKNKMMTMSLRLLSLFITKKNKMITSYNKITMMTIKNSSLPFDLRAHHCNLCEKQTKQNKNKDCGSLLFATVIFKKIET
jgi:hypothetical protein